MSPPPADAALAFAVWAGAVVISGAVLRIRRDITGPPLSRFVNAVWVLSLVGIGGWLLVVWFADLSDRWLMWPLALFEVGCLILVLWDTAREVIGRRRRSHRAV